MTCPEVRLVAYRADLHPTLTLPGPRAPVGLSTEGREGGVDGVEQLLVTFGPVDAIHVYAAFALPFPQRWLVCVRHRYRESEGVEVGRPSQEYVERVLDVVADLEPVDV